MENKKDYVLGDFDVWYKPCEKCGHDTAKSTKPKENNKTCWKCGNFISRDYSERALKVGILNPKRDWLCYFI